MRTMQSQLLGFIEAEEALCASAEADISASAERVVSVAVLVAIEGAAAGVTVGAATRGIVTVRAGGAAFTVSVAVEVGACWAEIARPGRVTRRWIAMSGGVSRAAGITSAT